MNEYLSFSKAAGFPHRLKSVDPLAAAALISC